MVFIKLFNRKAMLFAIFFYLILSVNTACPIPSHETIVRLEAKIGKQTGVKNTKYRNLRHSRIFYSCMKKYSDLEIAKKSFTIKTLLRDFFESILD